MYQGARGCNEKLNTPSRIEGYQVFECPRKSFAGVTRSYFEMFDLYTKNHLPCEGGVGKQPMKIMQIFKFIEDKVEKMREEKEKDG